jgi:thiamine biosynthesis protein ThiS
MSETTIGLTVNGQSVYCRPGSLLDYLLGTGLDPRTVVAEVNGQILNMETAADHRLAAGDQIEIVHFVGGG